MAIAATVAIAAAALLALAGLLAAAPSGAQDGAEPGLSDTPVAIVESGEYRLTSDYASESSWLRSFDTEVVGVGGLDAGADRTTWTFEVVIPGFYRLRQGDLYLTRDEDDSGPGRFLSLQPMRDEQRTQLWRIEPGTESAASPDLPTHRIVSAWERYTGVLSRDSIPQDDETYLPGDSVSVYEWFDWDSQRWFIVPATVDDTPPDEADPDVPTDAEVPAEEVPVESPAPDQAPEPTTVSGDYLTITSTCIGLNGRLDVLVRNASDGTATLRLDIGDLAPRFLTVAPGATGTATATGRPDGPTDVVVSLGDHLAGYVIWSRLNCARQSIHDSLGCWWEFFNGIGCRNDGPRGVRRKLGNHDPVERDLCVRREAENQDKAGGTESFASQHDRFVHEVAGLRSGRGK